jgi:hypothetical protein
MKGLIMSFTIPLECPECKKEFEYPIDKLKKSRKLNCPNPKCDTNITIKGDLSDIFDVNKSIDRIPKNINITFK